VRAQRTGRVRERTKDSFFSIVRINSSPNPIQSSWGRGVFSWSSEESVSVSRESSRQVSQLFGFGSSVFGIWECAFVMRRWCWWRRGEENAFYDAYSHISLKVYKVVSFGCRQEGRRWCVVRSVCVCAVRSVVCETLIWIPTRIPPHSTFAFASSHPLSSSSCLRLSFFLFYKQLVLRVAGIVVESQQQQQWWSSLSSCSVFNIPQPFSFTFASTRHTTLTLNTLLLRRRRRAAERDRQQYKVTTRKEILKVSKEIRVEELADWLILPHPRHYSSSLFPSPKPCSPEQTTGN